MLTKIFQEFHFIMSRGMKEDLKNLEMYKETGNLSGFIVNILTALAPVVKKEHKWGQQRQSRYMDVSNDPDERREHVHIYLPDEVYREMKLMHADLNMFSIAQLIRGFLDLFLDLVKVYGNNVFQELEKLFDHWNEENRKTRLTMRKFVRHLFTILRHLPDQNRLINIYGYQFSPFWVLRL